MKTILTILLAVSLCGCALAMPPTDVVTLTSVAPTAGAPVTGIVFLGANMADADFHILGQSACTNGDTVTLKTHERLDIYTAYCTGGATITSAKAEWVFTTNAPAGPTKVNVKF